MGAVYLGEHPTIGKKVAIKVLHAEFSNNADVANRFLTEAKAVTAIDHPNIVQIIDYGVLVTGGNRDQMVYITMEFLQGVTLSQLIRGEAPLAPERALTIAMQVADALAASHKIGIVHRDLKPDNIILVTRGRERDFVKVLDFGIAKLTGGGEGGLSSHRTRTGLVLGTPAYMSPEQCEGRPNVDHRTDIYALGIVLYEMLVGRVPFIGEGYGDILVQHLTQRPIEPSRYRMMSPHVEAVVMKALEKRPEMRYPTMDEFMRAMSDPVSFVESHGGVAGFAQAQLTPSAAPVPTVRLTPAPITAMPGMPSQLTPMPTPMHGQMGAASAMGMMSPAPGTLSPVPTTLGAATGQVAGGKRSKTGFLIGGGIVVAAAAVGIALVVSGGHKGGGGSGSATGSSEGSGSSEAAAGGSGSGAVVSMDPKAGSATGSAGAKAGTGTGTGSATAMAGSGSAHAAGTGSAAAGSGSAVAAVPDVKLMKLTVTSVPPGAEIYVDGVDLGKQTDTVLTLPIRHAKAQILLKLHGYQDFVIRDVPLDGDIAKTVTLRKEHAATPLTTHNGSGSHPGHGKGSGHSGNDTGLMSPDDL